MKLYQYQEQVSGIPTSLAPERSTPDKWQPQSIEPSRLRQSLTSSEQTNPLLVAEVIKLDKWNHDTNRPVPDVRRYQFLYPSSVIDANQFASEERVSPDRWQPNTNAPLFDIKRQQFLYPSFFVDTKQLTQTERVTVDKWQ